MNLLDKYILEVGKHLPRKNRLDVQAEIRSTLEDMIADRQEQTGQLADDHLVGEVLQEYGAPAKVAAAYRPPRYLIGPQMYPFFELVTKIVLAVITVLALVRLGLDLATGGAASGAEAARILGQALVGYFGGVISVIGNIVLVFAILERVLPHEKFETDDEKWTPADLDAIEDPDRASRAELIFEILFVALGLAVLNLYPDVIRLSVGSSTGWVFIPALSDAFFRYLPWINLLGVLQIVLNVYLLRQGVWNQAARLANIGLNIGGIILAGAMLTGPSLIMLDATRLGAQAQTIERVAHMGVNIALVVVIVIQAIEVVQMTWRLINARPATRLVPR